MIGVVFVPGIVLILAADYFFAPGYVFALAPGDVFLPSIPVTRAALLGD